MISNQSVSLSALRQAGETTSHPTKPASRQVAGYLGERTCSAFPEIQHGEMLATSVNTV